MAWGDGESEGVRRVSDPIDRVMKSSNVPDGMNARTTVAIGAIILAVAGTVVAVHHFKQAPLSPHREHFARLGGPMDSRVATEAVHYLHQLKIQGELPGFKHDEQCMVLMPDHSISEAQYPIILELQARKRNVAGPFPYHFELIKASADSGWRLQRAWRTDTKGNVAEEYAPS